MLTDVTICHIYTHASAYDAPTLCTNSNANTTQAPHIHTNTHAHKHKHLYQYINTLLETRVLKLQTRNSPEPIRLITSLHTATATPALDAFQTCLTEYTQSSEDVCLVKLPALLNCRRYPLSTSPPPSLPSLSLPPLSLPVLTYISGTLIPYFHPSIYFLGAYLGASKTLLYACCHQKSLVTQTICLPSIPIGHRAPRLDPHLTNRCPPPLELQPLIPFNSNLARSSQP